MADKAWNENEKCALAVAIIMAHGGTIPWAKVKTPAGRSTKACTHIWAKMKAAADEHNSGAAGSVDVEGEGIENDSPKKKKTAGRKRKAESDGEDKPEKAKRGRAKKAKKGEEGLNEGEVKLEQAVEGETNGEGSAGEILYD